MTARKKEILSYFDLDCRDWVTGEIGPPPFDVSGLAYLLHEYSTSDNRHQIESTRRTLEAMVRDGLLEKVASHEQRENRTSGRTWCVCSRYGLPGTTQVRHDTGGKRDAIDGEFTRCNRSPSFQGHRLCALLSVALREQAKAAPCLCEQISLAFN